MSHAERSLRILLVGSRILPHRHAGDKNFWLDVIRELGARGHEVDVLSVTWETVTQPTPYRCEYLRPIPFPLGGGERFGEEYHALRETVNYPSKTLSFPRIVRSIRRHLRSQRTDIVHFLSNYGPAMAFLKPFTAGVRRSISAPTYNGWSTIYDRALLASFAGFDCVVPFSDAFSRRLGALGVPDSKVRTIRWAVDPGRFPPPSERERTAARDALGVGPDRKVVFWAGFLQQMTARDLEFSVRTAERVLRAEPDGWRFLFCLKPEHYDPAFLRYQRPGITLAGSAEFFERSRTAADVMLSPISNLRSTAAPPLTWIETMARGVPLVTTPIPGADEIVRDGVNGLLVRSPEEAADRLLDLFRSRDRVTASRREARRCIEERFDFTASVRQYEVLWTMLTEKASGS